MFLFPDKHSSSPRPTPPDPHEAVSTHLLCDHGPTEAETRRSQRQTVPYPKARTFLHHLVVKIKQSRVKPILMF